MLEHGVEDNEQLAHAGCEGRFFGLPAANSRW